ncbi:uncharacterized protein MONBRDRAFT_31987 [Monosiga brevicollis MX1]|uniref:Protein kinase domain-containing protein n=1 Tax=Monosiga brevicollis TaxID=81824 RepID=A9UWN9_MONBE|nr:uncharacterized protein MONBRDRAFT_31987 [Monosiga brevicollis MX1]EDQ90246.1 predicted protein [Monosiga brevicollis MX1]|eukprot:XP_001745013.1 hypothetical protein [Monosiga brevicollis MX1]
MSEGYAAFKEAFTRLLDVKVARTFNQVLKDFMTNQDMHAFVDKLKEICLDPPERTELLYVVRAVLPDILVEAYDNELGGELLKIAQSQRDGSDLEEPARRSYEVHYLGSGGLTHIPTLDSENDQEMLVAVLRAIFASEQTATPVYLELTADSIRSVDVEMGHAITTCSLEHTVYCNIVNLTESAADTVLVLVYQDPIYEIVVAHYYTCSLVLAKEVVVAVLGGDIGTDQIADPFAAVEEAEEPAEGEVFEIMQLERRRLKHQQGLGAGQFGMVSQCLRLAPPDEGCTSSLKVYLAELSDDTKGPHPVAVKICRVDNKHEDELEFAREAVVMQALQHPHVVELVGVCMERKPWMLVLEYMAYGNLKSLLESCLERKLQLTSLEMIYMCRQLADALSYIHQKGFVHMDVAARNVLCGPNCLIKLADFGQSQQKDEEGRFVLRKVMRLSVRWMAPETLAGLRKVFSERTDVWGYAVTCWEVFMYGRTPFTRLKTEAARDMIMRGRARLTSRPPTTCPKDMWAVLCTCWDYEPGKRPLFAAHRCLRAELSDALHDLEDKRRGEPAPRDIGAMLKQ